MYRQIHHTIDDDLKYGTFRIGLYNPAFIR